MPKVTCYCHQEPRIQDLLKKGQKTLEGDVRFGTRARIYYCQEPPVTVRYGFMCLIKWKGFLGLKVKCRPN
ncbi:hypothetical protein AWC38_SpisGene2773 [Stylophora pistillata]|uniref:Uncharacterized protein n=1 Tax=Stylophora pistillata TaxID=50429 RepID=A0A2B4SNX8_STYPI|nr:hypothetical protein AWC38_SpisGene2773 [Stylophora pistillata]